MSIAVKSSRYMGRQCNAYSHEITFKKGSKRWSLFKLSDSKEKTYRIQHINSDLSWKITINSEENEWDVREEYCRLFWNALVKDHGFRRQ